MKQNGGLNDNDKRILLEIGIGSKVLPPDIE